MQDTETRPMKRASESRTEQVQILSPGTLNGYHRLFGGRLMEWIDVVAAVVARRHSNMNVTTAAVDSLDFTAPAYANDTVVLIGEITYVGRTSMEVRVRTYVEALDGTRRQINEAYTTLVALDDSEHPAPVPGLLCDTEAERADFEAGRQRSIIRKQRRPAKASGFRA